MDTHRLRRVMVPQELSHPGGQAVAVHARHALHPPMLRVLLDQLVDLGLPIHRQVEEVVGKAARLFVHFAAFSPKRFAHMLRRLLAHVPLKKHLQAKLARFATGAHASASCPSSWLWLFSLSGCWSCAASSPFLLLKLPPQNPCSRPSGRRGPAPAPGFRR